MYGYIKGMCKKITPKNIIVENNGIGYLIIVPNPYDYKLETLYTVYTHLYVREDIFDLYGFLTMDEKDLFLKLISVSGIGPKSALSILASGTVKEIVSAIESSNANYLKKFPGIGAKASQQIILDLQGKLSYNGTDIINVSQASSKLDDVIDALVALGYTKKDATKVVAKLDPSMEEGELVKEALKKLIR